MLDSILIAQSGLSGHQKGLKTIGNNVSNMNTVGFKASSASFSDAFVADNAGNNGANGGFGGAGLDAHTATLNLRSGELRQTGNGLDSAIDGNAFFTLQDASGGYFYTKDGQFEFDPNGTLIGRTNKMQVLGRASGGKLSPITIGALSTNPPKATTSVKLDGNLSSSATTHTIESLKVFDSLGGEHTLKLTFTSAANSTPGLWSVSIIEGVTELTKGEVRFIGGVKDPSTGKLKFEVAPNSEGKSEIELVIADGVTSFSTGTTSSLASKEQDGYGLGLISKTGLNHKGEIKVSYSNGQSAIAGVIALAQFSSESELAETGQSVFRYTGATPPTYRTAGDDLKLATETLEYSNVDLTDQFSALILMQRGYQASSQVLSTANDMIQELFDMKGRR